MLRPFCLIVVSSFLFFTVQAQKPSILSENDPVFSASVEYTSNVNFQGRKIGNDQFGYTVGAEYAFDFGLTAHYAADYWSGFGTSGISQHTLGVSYLFDVTPWLQSEIAYEHWFLNSPDANSNSALNNYFTLDLKADANFLQPHFTAYYIKGSEKAYGFEAGIAAKLNLRTFNNKSSLRFSPDITLMTGTDTRITNIVNVIKRRKVSMASTTTDVFGLLNTEITGTLTYSHPNYELTGAMHLAIPHSLGASDNASGTFSYFTLGFNYFIITRAVKTDSGDAK